MESGDAQCALPSLATESSAINILQRRRRRGLDRQF